MIDYKALLQKEWSQENDPTHDIAHIERVLVSALSIQSSEGGDLSILVPAVWFHDLVNLPKDHDGRARASTLSAERAVGILKGQGMADPNKLERIYHAIQAHSFSAGIVPQTLEARILQDADRLDALGCIGMMRTFAVSGKLDRALFDPADPFAKKRELNDAAYALDHFEVKLFKIAEALHTKAAQEIAQERVSFMRLFLQQFASEINCSKASQTKAA